MVNLVKKSFKNPDQTATFPNGKTDTIDFSGMKFSLLTFEPGWKWTKDVKPIAKTESCQAQHTTYHISGRLHVVMDDGTEEEFGPGDIAFIAPGHDAWTVGDEAVVALNIGVVSH